MKKTAVKLCTFLALLVMLTGVAHAMQHTIAHDDSGHYEQYYEHSCLQADVSGDDSKAVALAPPAFLTNAPHLPRTATPRQVFVHAQYARGPPPIL